MAKKNIKDALLEGFDKDFIDNQLPDKVIKLIDKIRFLVVNFAPTHWKARLEKPVDKNFWFLSFQHPDKPCKISLKLEGNKISDKEHQWFEIFGKVLIDIGSHKWCSNQKCLAEVN